MELFKVKFQGDLVDIKSKSDNLDILEIKIKKNRLQNLDIKYFIASYFNVNIKEVQLKTIYETYHRQKDN